MRPDAASVAHHPRYGGKRAISPAGCGIPDGPPNRRTDRDRGSFPAAVTHRQQRHDLLQQFDLQAALDCPLVVLLKAGCVLDGYFTFLIFSGRQTTRQGHCSPLRTDLFQSFPLPAWQPSFPCWAVSASLQKECCKRLTRPRT